MPAADAGRRGGRSGQPPYRETPGLDGHAIVTVFLPPMLAESVRARARESATVPEMLMLSRPLPLDL